MQMRQYQTPDLIFKKSSFDLKPLHAVHEKPNHSKPEVMHVFSWIQDLKKERKNKNKNSYLSRWLLIYRLMYNIDKLNRDQ